jgi:Ca2+:H+ antiporter
MHPTDPYIVIDIHRRRARFSAWYDETDGQPNRNPFKKFRPVSRHAEDVGPEDGLLPTRSEGDTISMAEQDRRRDATKDLPPPAHAHTSPSSSGTQNEPRTQEAERSPESTASGAPLASPDAAEYSPLDHRGRNISFGQSSKGTGLDSLIRNRTNSSKKRKFTPLGQLKATLLNSWVNVLLFAAPAGSKSPFNLFS